MNIPDTMHAFVLEGHGDFDKLVFHENWPVPVPGEQEVLIKVAACGLNNTDVNTRTGWYSKSVSEATTISLPDALREATGRDTVSVVADIVGGAAFGSLIDVLERGGRYTCSGAIAGPLVELDLRTFYLRDLTFTGSTVLEPHIFGDLVSYIERGDIRPMLAATYPLHQLHEAQRAFIEKKHSGNIVVTMDA